MQVISTRHGVRLSDHGVVISELRSSPGPTHSVFDVLAAAIAVLAPRPPIGILGFAGGGLMAPLRALGMNEPVQSVDLDPVGHRLFRQHAAGWAGEVGWQQADAAAWLEDAPHPFGLLLEDLSVSTGHDVLKPAISWNGLARQIRSRLRPGGVAVFNLLKPAPTRWEPEFSRVADLFRERRLITLEEYENRILVGGQKLPEARELGRRLRAALRQVGSRQAGRIQVRTA